MTTLITKTAEQKTKVAELLAALHAAGYTEFTSTTSVTNMGVSTYIQGQLGIKFRISDHNVSNFNRINNEEHISLNTTIEDVLLIANRRASSIKKSVADKARKNEAVESKWAEMQRLFTSELVFKMNNRTYQDLDTFLASSPIQKLYVQQTVLTTNNGRKVYSYEYAEERENNPTAQYGYDRPSDKFISNFNFN